MDTDGKDFATERTQSPQRLESETMDSAAKAEIGENATSRSHKNTTSAHSVSFDERNFNVNSPARARTFASEKSTTSSIFEPPWQKQYVLSFDGGGIRGYSSLLIIQKLIDFIVEEELEQHRQHIEQQKQHTEHTNRDKESSEADVESSYHPLPFPSDIDEPASLEDDLIGEIVGQKILSRRWLRNRRKEVWKPKKTDISTRMTDDELAIAVRERVTRSKYLPCLHFYYMGGTSTGGLISILLSRLRLPIDEALDMYETLGGRIFGHPRLLSVRGPILFPRDKYSGKQLVKVVKEVVEKSQSKKRRHVGDHFFMSHERMCKTIAVAFEGHQVEDKTLIETQAPYLFRSYDHHPHVPPNVYERNPGFSQRVRIWQVARAITAAPTYFNTITIDNCRYGDGGFGANNPISEIYWEVCQMNGNARKCIGLLMSVGTGCPDPEQVQRYDKSSPWKYLAWMKVAGKLASDSENAHKDIDRNFKGDSAEDRVPYHRFNVPYKISKNTAQKQPSRRTFVTPNDDQATAHTKPTTTDMTGNSKPASSPLHRLQQKLHHRLQRAPTTLGDMRLDEWRTLTLSSIKNATDAYLSTATVSEELHKIAKELVQARRARSRTIHWDLYSTGTEYRCMYDGCVHPKAHKMRPHARNLQRHLEKSHDVYEEELLKELVSRGRCEH